MKNDLKIIHKNISELIPYTNNPRVNNNAVGKVAESIKQFGFKVPLVIDSNNEIIAGHTRLKAAKMLELEKVPCIIADDLTPEQVKAYRLIDNKVGEFSGWDLEILETELKELEMFDLDFDMEEFGFDSAEKKPNKTAEERTDLSGELDVILEVVVECDDAEMQEEVYNKLIGEGYKCRVLTL